MMNRLIGEENAAVGRNDLCPCGSGKKYKKCCGTREAENGLMKEQNQIFQEVLQDFFENHPQPSQQKSLLDWKDKTEDLLVPLYGEDKSGGIIGDAFFFSEHVEIWNAFIEHKLQHEQRPQIRQVLASWIDPVFLAGEILSISNYRAEMRDLLSEKLYTIDVNESFPVETGNIAFAFYLPDLRAGENFLMALNSVTAAVDVIPETVGKLKDMYRSSEAETVQEFYKRNLIAIYQMFSSGLRGAHDIAEEVLTSVHKLEAFLIEQDLKSDILIEAFFHYLEPLPAVPNAAISGAVQFGINEGLLDLAWAPDKTAEVFEVAQEEILAFAEGLHVFYSESIAHQEKEAEYAFEVGTNPKAKEFHNWQLFMHLKHTSITSEAALKRHMEYYHDKPYEPKSDSEKAQLLAYGLFAESAQPLQAEQLQELKRFDPLLPDGFILAAASESDPLIKQDLLKKAIHSARSHYEPEMDVPWLYIPNRPYLRAVFLLGVHYWEQGKFEEAFTEFKNLLGMNPGDHQGARYLAVSSLLALGRLDEAESLIAHYEDDYSDNAFYSWFKWLIQRQRSLHSKATQELFLKALEQNPYVKKHIEKRPAALPYPEKAIITPRSPEEARLIWSFLAPSMLG